METLLPIIAIGVIFWLLIIRPAQRRQKEALRLQGSVGAGAQVMLTSGIFGTVTEADPEEATLRVEIAPGVEIKVARGAIGTVITPDDELDEADEADEAGEHSTAGESVEETTRTTDNEER